MLIQFDSGYFCAGAEFEGSLLTCTRAAPIIHWMVGKSYDDVYMYAKRKGWKILRPVSSMVERPPYEREAPD